MFNLLRAELYKLWHSKVLWVLGLIITVVFTFFILFAYLGEIGVFEETDIVRIEVEDVVTDESPLSGMKILIETAYGPDIFTFVLLISCLGAFFLARENSTGTIKNIAATGYQRWQIYITKLVVFLIGSLVLSLMFVLIPVVVGAMFFGLGEWPDQETIIKTGQILLISWLYYFSFASIVTLFSILSRGSGMALLFSIGYYLVVGAGLRALGMKYVFFEKLNGYSVYYLFSYVGERIYEQANILPLIMVPLATITIFTGLGVFLFQRKDIQ